MGEQAGSQCRVWSSINYGYKGRPITDLWVLTKLFVIKDSKIFSTVLPNLENRIERQKVPACLPVKDGPYMCDDGSITGAH